MSIEINLFDSVKSPKLTSVQSRGADDLELRELTEGLRDNENE